MRSTLLFVALAACSGAVSGSDAGAGGGTAAQGGGSAPTGGGSSAVGGGSSTGGGTAAAGGGSTATGGGTGATGGGTGATGGGTGATGGGTAAVGGGTATTDAGLTLAAQYPGDVGLANDPDVVWVEDFEEANEAAVRARYDTSANPPGQTLIADVPPGSHGLHSMKLTSGVNANATDFFKSFMPNGYDELYVRWYAKYQAGITWHHSGMWIGGYNPMTDYPNPQAGEKPTGTDRFSIAFEINTPGVNAKMDFYNYWMTMHSWMQTVTDDGTSYYGNAVIHDPNVKELDDTWLCAEIHVKLNPDPTSKAGAVLELFIADQLVRRFDDSGPMGYWTADKFCPNDATGTECTMYRPPAGTPLVTLDQQYRATSALKLSHFWPQNYITSGPDGSLELDDMVVATRRIGCLR